MNRLIKLSAMCGIGLLVVMGTIALFTLPRSLSQNKVMPLELTLPNGGFEEPYADWPDLTECQIADQWSLYTKTDWPGETLLAEPKAGASDHTSPGSTGSRSQHLTPQGARNFDACVYQQVSGITVGNWIRFSAWARVDTSMAIPDAQTRIGIDPGGGTDPLDIQYETHQSYWDVFDASNGSWQQLSVSLRVISTTATVYACAHPRWAMDFHVYWDDAEIQISPNRSVYFPAVVRDHCVVPDGELYNPGLERDFCIKHGYQAPIPGYTNVFVAPYWMPFWNDNYDGQAGINAQPEYNYTDRSYRVHSGQVAQQYGKSANQDVFEAGIYQVVTGTFNVSDTVHFTIWGLGWSSTWANKDNERYSDVRDGLRFKVGIDPSGSESFTSTNIIWSGFFDPYDEWHQFEISTTMPYSNTKISVWAYTNPVHSWASFNQVFWDSADLSVIRSAPEEPSAAQ